MRGKGDNVSRRRRSTGDRPGDRPRFISSSTNSSSRQANQLDGYRSQSRPRVPWHIVVHQGWVHILLSSTACVWLASDHLDSHLTDHGRRDRIPWDPRRVGGVHRSSRSRCDGRDVPPKGTCRVRESSPCPVLSPSFETGIWTAHIAPCSEPSLSVSQDSYTVAGHVHYLHPNQFHLSVTTARLFVATRCGCFCTGMVGGWEGFRGHGGVTPWGPLSYLPLHLLHPLTPFENTTPHSLGFHGAIRNLVRLRRDTERR